MHSFHHRFLFTLYFASLSSLASFAAGVSAVVEYSLTPDRPETVFSLSNVNGTIRLESWDGPTVEIHAAKSAGSQEELEAITIQIDPSPGKIAVKTEHKPVSRRWFSRKTQQGSVNYTVRLPRDMMVLAVNSTNGQVLFEGISRWETISTVNGSISSDSLPEKGNVRTVNGSVSLNYNRAGALPSLSVSTVNGTVRLILPTDCQGEIQFQTVNGRLRSDFHEDVPKGRKAVLVLEDGNGGEVFVKTVNGSLHLQQKDS